MQNDLAKLLTLPEIFEDRLFRIPDYQRGYAWGSDQVNALLNDIDQLFEDNHMHYTGTLVIIESTEKACDGNTSFDVIDGQQRLTTFSIILACLIKNIACDEKRKELSQLYTNRGVSGDKTQVLQLNKNANSLYKSCVIEHQTNTPKIEFISEKYILNAYAKINEWINQQSNRGRSINDLLGIITSKFGFIVYRPSEPSEAGMMFEVINNRGKPLTELDKVKNYLVYYAIKRKKKNLQEKVNEHWGIILRNLAKAHKLKQPDEDALLRATVVCHFGFNTKECSDIYSTIKEKIPLDGPEDDWLKLTNFVDFLSRASSFYECVINDNSERRKAFTNGDIIKQIENIRSLGSHASAMPLFFAVMERQNELDEEIVVDLLRMIEILIFRVYMTRNGAKKTNHGQASIYKIAHALTTNNDQYRKDYEKETGLIFRDINAAIFKNLADIIELYCNDDRFEEGLTLRKSDTDDFYKWNGIRYFLMSYEQHIDPKRNIRIDDILKKPTKGASNDKASLEHIWATKNILKGSEQRLVEDTRSKRQLGNFALLESGINSQASDKGLHEKVGVYDGQNTTKDKSNFKQIHSLISDYKGTFKKHNDTGKKKTANFYRSINVETISSNESRYIAFAKERWSAEWATKYWSTK